MRRLILVLALLSSLGFAQEIRRPTSEANDAGGACGATVNPSGVFPNAYDASGETTSSVDSIDDGSLADNFAGRKFYDFAAASGTYSGNTLKVVSSCVKAGNGTSGCTIEYSTNAGSTWTTLVSNSLWAKTTHSAVVTGTAQNQLQVRACYRANSGSSVSTTLTIWDIRTEGSTGGKRVKVIQ